MATPVPVLVAGALFVGGAAGVAAESAGFSPVPEPDAPEVVEEPGVVLGPAVSVHDCPDGAVVAALAGGDGVLATGRTEDGLWVEIRSPLDVTAAAWLSVGVLDADGDIEDLPVHECAVAATTTTTGSTTSTSTTSTSTTTTTTTQPGETTTTRPPVTQPPTTSPPTTAPDRSPTVNNPASNQAIITTRTPANADCVTMPQPDTAQITVSASDDRPGLVVTMSFRTISNGNVVNPGGALSVQGPINGVYRATLGPLPNSSAPASGQTFVEVTARATDSGGNVVTRVSNVAELRKCNA